MKKHGIHISYNNKTQTKRIYNNGYLMQKYSNQPLNIIFKNNMINDMNQHFCGGWSISGLDTSDSALLSRVFDGKKPIAIITIHNEKQKYDYIDRIDNTKYDYKLCIYPITKCEYLAISPKGKLKDLFDLETLKKDYNDNNINIDIKSVEDKELKDYFDGWDIEDVNLWETGLILGYPIENTISLYKHS